MTARRALRYTALAAAAAGAFFLLAAADLGLRGRGAYERARRHAAWRDNPAAKAEHYARLYEERAAAVKKQADGGELTAEQAGRALTLAAADRDFSVSESSAKQAVIWYRSAADDFNSPFNRWAPQARRELPAALAAWRAELEARGVKAEDWMLQ
jgi:hypothetical protein